MRKNIFVDFIYQTRIFLKITAVIVFSSIVCLFFLRRFMTHNLSQDFAQSFFALTTLKSHLAVLVAFPILVFFLLSSILISVIMIYISHKIAGPLYHLEKYLERLKSGDFSTDLFFRKDDQIKNLSVEINKMVGGYRTDLIKERNRIEKISGMMDRIKTTYETGLISETDLLLKELKNIIIT